MKYVALCGGVGGAKLALGLAQVLPPESLLIAVNVGDDFEHLGLTICPDLDTVLYTLAGLVHAQQGWGRADESWAVLDELRRLSGETWFQLGDRDIALHLLRRHWLDSGCTPSEISLLLAQRLGVRHTVVPVTDQSLRTVVHTDQGSLPFQDYFVRLRCLPRVQSVEFVGSQAAMLAPLVQAALLAEDLAGVIVCPSNPYLSVAPMLAVGGLRMALQSLPAPVVAVSPIVAGEAIKGPTAKIMRELGVHPTARVIAELYAEFVDRVIIDTADAALAADDARLVVSNTVMQSAEQKIALAHECVAQLTVLRNAKVSHEGGPKC
jgi:LPPG:FO 2-phospho-L-lactate transferase